MSPDYSGIPARMREERRWLVWRPLDGEKPPVGDDGRRLRDWQQPDKWLSWDEARARAARWPDAGLGFELGGGFSGFDLDDCRDPETGQIQAVAEGLVRDAASYTEVSPSGTGVKVFGLAALPGVELNFNGHGLGPDGMRRVTKTFQPNGSYFAVTGDAVASAELADISGPLSFWLGWYEKQRGPREASEPLPERIGDGGRNSTLFREGARLRRLGLDEREIAAALHAINEGRCHPPLDAREVEQVARSCARYEPAADPYPATEQGDAEFFAACNGELVRFDHRRGLWRLFGGHRWEAQTDGEVARLATDAVRARQRAAVGDKDRMRWAVAGESRKRQSNLLALAQNVQPIADDGAGWDADPWLLGVANGVVDLRTGLLEPGRPGDRISMGAAVPYDPGATCPLWDATLAAIFPDNADLLAYFDRLVGYTLTGDCREEVLALCWGGGANGKSTVLGTLGWLLGDYADDLPFSSLEMQDRGGIPNDLAKIVGKRFVTSSESGETKRLNEARVKALTGRDPITARFLHREFFTFQPVAKFWLATNHRPVVRDTSMGFWRRIHLIPFTQSFAGNPDLKLKDKLREEGPGILARAVRGCLAWQREGLRPPAAVLEATRAYRADSNPVAEFLDECCVLSPGAVTTFGKLFEAYTRWHAGGGGGRHRLTRPDFGEALRERFEEDHWERNAEGKRLVAFRGVGLVARGQEGDL